MTDGPLPIVDPPAPFDGESPAPSDGDASANPDADTSDVLGVVLAAGTSSRFGAANKLLATIDGDPLVRRAAKTLLDAGLEVVVVLGHDAADVRDALDGLDVSFVANAEYERGQSTSVRRGVDAARRRAAAAVVFLPGDMPFVSPGTVRALLAAFRGGAGEALAVAHEGQRGNPVLFDESRFDALGALEGDVGGRPVLLGSNDAALVAVDDPGVRTDVDTRDELETHR